MNGEGIKAEIVSHPVTEGMVTEWLGDPAHGAEVIFFGAVRDHNDGRKVIGVHYDCYVPLALSTLKAVIREARERFGDELRVCVLHAKGYLKVGELSVGIGVSAPHRAEAFDGCRYIIEEIKIRVPIWKQEHYTDGDSEWVQGHALCQHEKEAQAC